MTADQDSAAAGNFLLARLAPADREAVFAALEPVELPRLMRLEERGRRIDHVYFPISGVASVVATDLRARQLEVALIGREGMSGLAVLLGDGRAPYDCFMQLSGAGFRIASEPLAAMAEKSPSLRRLMLTYAQAYMVQMAHTAVAHGRSTIGERLARWLLMTHDRIEGDVIAVTHEFLAIMLGVRRPGVTVALQQLEETGPIRRVRSTVEIVDRPALVKAANGSYGAAEAEHVRLFGTAHT